MIEELKAEIAKGPPTDEASAKTHDILVWCLAEITFLRKLTGPVAQKTRDYYAHKQRPTQF